MRIGVFTYGIHGERMTGIARYTVELTRALRRVDPSLDIVLLNPHDESEHPWYREFPTYPLRHLRLLPTAATIGNLSLHRAALQLELDVLHDPCGIAPFLAPSRNRYARVTTIHDAIPARFPDTQPPLTRLVFQTLVRSARWSADAVLTVSKASAMDLTTIYGIPPDKIHVTPNGTQPSPPLSKGAILETLSRLGLRRPYFLYVGALHPRKNLPRVLEAFTQVQSHADGVQLAVVGPPSWGANAVLRHVIERANANEGVVFTGFVSDQDLQALYEGTVALVFPSLYEGFGLPALEAMSHGAPVVTSNRSALPEVVGDAALLVEPTSIDEIVQAMTRLLREPDLQAALKSRGRDRSTQFTWEATAERTLVAFSTAVRGVTR